MTLTDIEDHKQGEALRVGEKRLLEMIATGDALEDILNALSLMIEEQRSGTLASVLLLNPDGVHLDFVAGPSLPDEWRQQMAKLPIGPCAGSCGTAAFRGSPVIVSDIKTDPLWEVPEHRASALKHGLRASWSSPVLSSKGKVLGTFCMYYREPRSPSSQDLELIGFATHFVRIAIERDRAEEALRRNEQRLRDVIDTIPTITWSTLPNGATDLTSRYWLEYTGVSTEDSLGDGWKTAFHPADIAEHVEKWTASLATGKPFENEARVQRADGEYRWFLHRAVPLRDGHGTIVKWYGTAIDIEDRKQAEEERLRLRQLEGDLAHINRVSMMGELAASLAHDIKQPLTGAVMSANACLQWLRRDPPDMTEASEAASRMVSNVTRATEIIDRVQALFKRDTPERELVDVNDIAREMIALLRHTANRNSISIRTELDAALPTIAADRVQLQQVLMNLMLNGIEAMKDAGGELTLTSNRTDEGHILISVSDSGIGLPAHEAERIYEAFFTTKPQGTGMGLSISRRIIESHGGRLWASNNTRRGTTFQFSLPVNVTGSPPFSRNAGEFSSEAELVPARRATI
ncbi:MAG: ATP-binding protein, partial [Xanthobacteraceae bacterium]